jgi:hypothetical protein
MLARTSTAALAALALAANAAATTFGNETRPDPFAKDKSCDTPELHSWGTYVYDWPSKYDLVFEPQISPFWIWRCEASGYVSFADDFDQLTAAERTRIATFLQTAVYRPKSARDDYDISEPLLRHLASLYDLRDKDPKFRAYFLRYLAWQHGQQPAADAYRKKAYELHAKMQQPGGWVKTKDELETLYILGFYAFKLGRIGASQVYFRDLDNAWTLESSTATYLRTLARDVRAGKADDRVRFKNEN